MGGHQVDDLLGVKFERYVYSDTHMCVWHTHTHTHTHCECHLFIYTTSGNFKQAKRAELSRLCNRLAWHGMKYTSAINLTINLLGLTVHWLPVTINIT